MNTAKKNLFNFGKGWWIIIYCLLMFWFYAGMNNDGTNIIAPAIAERLGVPIGNVLSMGTIAGVVAVIFYIIIGQICKRIGARITSGICLFLAGIGYLGVGMATSLAMYAVFLCLTAIGAMSAAYIAGGPLVAQWFPKTKGVVMGYTTMGLNFSSAIYVPMISALVAALGVQRAVLVPVIMIALLAVAGLFTVRNTPMERGIYPDNVSNEVYQREYYTQVVDHNAGWTVKKLITAKNYWLAAITTGILQLITGTIICQLVVRNQEIGFSYTTAITIMSILSFVGIFGSWLFGVFDNLWGTKRTMIMFAVFYLAAVLFNFTEVTALVYISIVMIGLSIGGSANFTVSLPSAVFGRHGYEAVSGMIVPLQALITCLMFVINGIVLNLTGSVRGSYLVAAALCILDVILLVFVDEHKYNKDYIAEKNSK